MDVSDNRYQEQNSPRQTNEVDFRFFAVVGTDVVSYALV